MQDLFSFPFSAGYKENSTSRDAAIKIEANGKAEALRKRVYDALRFPMTVKELSAQMNVDLNSVRPRCSELFKRGMIRKTGERRLGQHVWRAV